MAKINFIQDNIINESIGIMLLSSYLKAKGHEVKLSILGEYKNIDVLLSEISDFNPDLVGFSVMTPQVNRYLAITKILKDRTDHMIIWGGAHCTFMPDVVMKHDEIDIICIGEGEEALLTLMDRLDAKKDYSDIPNLWTRKNGGLIKNDVGGLETDLDRYPFPDRDLYYNKSAFLRGFVLKRILTQRGCPYNCNYCFEPAVKYLYNGKGRLVRRHSVKYVIDELLEIIRKYPTRFIHFSDDSFNLDKKWVMRFLPEYKKNINLPFSCNLVVPLIDEELIKGLKENGCHGIITGVESGVERIRIEVLNKPVTNEQLYNAVKLINKYKIKVMTNNMFAIPTETLDDAIETIRFNKTLKLHGIRICMLKMYKGTKLAEFAVNNGLVEAEGEFTYKAKDIGKKHESMKNLIWSGYFMIKLPLLINFAKEIITKPIFKLFKPIIILGYWQEITFFKIPLSQAWRYFLYDRKLFMQGVAKSQKDTYGIQE